MDKAEDSPWGWEQGAGIWPGWSGKLGKRMAFLGRVEKRESLAAAEL